MRLYGKVINCNDKIRWLIDKCKEIASNNKLKFKKVEIKEVNLKNRKFEKLIFYFDLLPDKVEFSYLLNLCSEITSKAPSYIELNIADEWYINFKYCASVKAINDTKNTDLIAIFYVKDCNENNITFMLKDLETINKCNELWKTTKAYKRKKKYDNIM